MKLKKISKRYPEAFTHLASDMLFVIIKDDESEEAVTLSGAVIRQYIFNMYNNFHFYDGHGKFLNSSDAQTRLVAAWELFRYSYADIIKDIYGAIDIKYAPLDNYDKYSVITTTDNDRTDTTLGKVTSSTGSTESETNGTITNTESGSEKTDVTEASLDVDSTNKSSSTTTFGTGTTPRKSEQSYDAYTQVSTQTDEAYTDYGQGLKNVKTGSTDVVEHTHGNIGVVTSSSMLESYLLTRLKCNVYEYIGRLYADMFLRL